MEVQYFKEFFIKSPTAYSYLRVISDDQGVPVDYQFLELNEAYENMMGIKAAGILNKRFYEVFPNGWEGESQWKESLHDAILNKNTTHFDMHHYTIQKWIRVSIFPLQDDVFACIFKDITIEYMLDKEIDGFLKVNLEMLCVATTDGKFLKVNKQFELVLGYKVEEIENLTFYSLVHKDDLPSTIEIIKDLENQKSITSFVNRVRCKDGAYKYLEWRSQPNGKLIYASARDITKKRLKEIKLIQLTEKLQKKNEVLKTLAITDELTGLYNRHFIDQWIEKEMASTDRYQKPLSMIIIDLDHFKRVNDKWGHPVGDKVLKFTADIIRSNLRKSDVLARMGGEEFAIFLPQCPTKNAIIVAEKLRKLMENADFPIVGKVTASFGVSERWQGESFNSWYKRADEALYCAKEGGRNRVISSNDQETVPVAFVRIDWKQEWDSGHQEIDQQHREMVKHGNRLIFMSLSNASHEKTLQQLDLVLNLVANHFNYEEHFLEEIGYSEYENHRIIHKDLLKKAFLLKENFQNGDIKSSPFFSFIVDDIIVGHMLKDDFDYFKYLQI